LLFAKIIGGAKFGHDWPSKHPIHSGQIARQRQPGCVNIVSFVGENGGTIPRESIVNLKKVGIVIVLKVRRNLAPANI
jgi:hypothetical protein